MSTDPDTTNGSEDKETRTSMKGIVTILQLCCLRFMNVIARTVTTDSQDRQLGTEVCRIPLGGKLRGNVRFPQASNHRYLHTRRFCMHTW